MFLPSHSRKKANLHPKTIKSVKNAIFSLLF